jgi:hypothetical protein
VKLLGGRRVTVFDKRVSLDDVAAVEGSGDQRKGRVLLQKMFAAQEQGNKESCAGCRKLDPVQSVKEIIQPRVARSPNAGKEM